MIKCHSDCSTSLCGTHKHCIARMGFIRIVRRVLVIWFAVCFLKATAEGMCATTFPSEDNVSNTLQGVVVPEQIQNNLIIQWVFPSMTFGCNGNIIRWIFQVQKNSNSNIQILPKFQLWRNQSVTPDYNSFLLELMNTSGSEEELSGGEGPVYEYILRSELEVRVGYVFGIHLPQSGNNERPRVKFLDMGEGGSPSTSYFRDSHGITFDIRPGSNSFDDQRYVPLIAVEISLSSSMTTTVLLSPTPQTANDPTPDITPGSTTAVIFPSTITPTPSVNAQNPGPTTSETLFIIIGTTFGGALTTLIIVIVVIVLLTRYIQAKRKHSNSDRADDIQTGPNEAYGTILTSRNIAYELTVPPHKEDSYSYPLAVHEETRYTESTGGEYDYCRPTC